MTAINMCSSGFRLSPPLKEKPDFDSRAVQIASRRPSPFFVRCIHNARGTPAL